MNRALLKQDAKNAMSMANPHPVLTTLAFMAVQIAAQVVLYLVSTVFGVTSSLTMGIMMESGGYYSDYSSTAGTVSTVGMLIYILVAVLLSPVLGVVQFGYTSYSLKVFKGEETGVNELFSHFSLMFKVFGLSLWMSLFIFLWACLCYIPGIIAALRYSQAFYILAENPEKGIRQCVNESKMMMSGRIWEYFVLQLSFVLWTLLGAVTCGIANLYVTPYMTITNAGYYLSLKPEDIYTNASYTQTGGFDNNQNTF